MEAFAGTPEPELPSVAAPCGSSILGNERGKDTPHPPTQLGPTSRLDYLTPNTEKQGGGTDWLVLHVAPRDPAHSAHQAGQDGPRHISEGLIWGTF